MKYLLLFFLFSFCLLHAQNLLNQPESIVYDENNQYYLVSNEASGEVVKIDSDGIQSYFNTDFLSIRGLHIVGNYLYASTNAGIGIIDLSNGSLIQTVLPTDSQFLNGITSDENGNIYASDTTTNTIYKMRISDYTTIAISDEALINPNGLLFDRFHNRILICSWQSNSPIQALDLETNEVTTVVETTYDNCDGLAKDQMGYIYLSSWGSNSIYRYDRNFENDPILAFDNIAAPADIYFNSKNNVLCVPKWL